MDSLKTRYQSLNQLFFCEDYLIDGILTDFAAFCKQQEIEADILFQNYHRGNIQIEDIVDILLKFIKYAKIAGKVQLHVAAVKNQLIFSMKLTEKNMKKTAKVFTTAMEITKLLQDRKNQKVLMTNRHISWEVVWPLWQPHAFW